MMKLDNVVISVKYFAVVFMYLVHYFFFNSLNGGKNVSTSILSLNLKKDES